MQLQPRQMSSKCDSPWVFFLQHNTLRIHEFHMDFIWDYNLHIMNRLAPFFFMAFLCASAAYSQSGGTITGTVVDSDGEAVVNAQVQATNRSTKTVYKIAGSEKGHYTLPALPPGAYDVTVNAP